MNLPFRTDISSRTTIANFHILYRPVAAIGQVRSILGQQDYLSLWNAVVVSSWQESIRRHKRKLEELKSMMEKYDGEERVASWRTLRLAKLPQPCCDHNWYLGLLFLHWQGFRLLNNLNSCVERYAANFALRQFFKIILFIRCALLKLALFVNFLEPVFGIHFIYWDFSNCRILVNLTVIYIK